MGRRLVRFSRLSIRSHEKALSYPWSAVDSSQLIYSNIRALLLVNNKSFFAPNEWEVVNEDKAHHITMFMQHSPNNVTCIRLKFFIPTAPKNVFDVVVDNSQRTKWVCLFSFVSFVLFCFF